MPAEWKADVPTLDLLNRMVADPLPLVYGAFVPPPPVASVRNGVPPAVLTVTAFENETTIGTTAAAP